MAQRRGVYEKVRVTAMSKKADAALCFDHLLEHLRWQNLGHVLAGGNMRAGDIEGKPEVQQAYELGRSIQ